MLHELIEGLDVLASDYADEHHDSVEWLKRGDRKLRNATALMYEVEDTTDDLMKELFVAIVRKYVIWSWKR
jgi:hypothetical protein